MKYTLKLTTVSYLLSSSGEGSALIDADVVYHKTGFPYIPARRVKGLLRESMQEVFEISSIDDNIIADKLEYFFGKEGDKKPTGLLKFKNLYIPQWEKIKIELPKYKRSFAFQPENIRKFFTTEIAQTSIEEDGVAKEKSLRNYRLLRPGITFDGYIETCNSIKKEDIEYLDLALANLRYAGTRRNRGFGKIKCQIEEFKETSTATNKQEEIPDINYLEVQLTTLSPVVIAMLYGEQNTVATSKVITGNQLRGVLAWDYLNRHGYDDNFYKLFLSGNLKFGHLTYNGSAPLPLNIHEFKGFDNKPFINVFEYNQLENADKQLQTRSIGGFSNCETGKLIKAEPETSYFFHNTRMQNRTAGRNTKEDDSGIFYYEAMDEDQIFIGSISGNKDELKLLYDTFKNVKSFSLGKSRSAQYGDIALNFNAKDSCETAMIKADQFMIILQTHLILFNEFEFPQPTAIEFIKQLKAKLGIRDKLKIKHRSASHTIIEQYNASWQAKSGKINAFKEGSAFVVESESLLDIPSLLQLGEWNEQGFGVLKVEAYKPDLIVNYQKPEKDIEKDKEDILYDGETEILKSIFESYSEEKENIKIRTQSIGDAGKYARHITGHLISRIEMMILEYDSLGGTDKDKLQKVNTWFGHIKEKPAGQKLKKAGIMDDDGKMKFDKYPTFAASKLYWITLLQTLRKLNKHEQ